jgi:Holliday junction resolvasome RuvABC endonuclease subunit
MDQTPSTIWLGIDPSATSTGLAIITPDLGLRTETIRPKELRGGKRLKHHQDALLNFVREHKEKRILACIEGPSLDSTNKADTLGQVRGVFLVTLENLGAEVTVVQPTTLKKFATRSGSSDKEDMVKAAFSKWNVMLKDDAADAAWLAQIAWSLMTNKVDTREQLEVISGIRSPKEKPVVRFKVKINV